MPFPNDQANPAGAIPVYFGVGAGYNPAPPVAPPASIDAGDTYDTGLLLGAYRAIAVSAELTQTGEITVQRYIDTAGTIPIGEPVTQPLTANTLGYVAINDGLPSAAFSVAVENTGGGAADLSNFAILGTG